MATYAKQRPQKPAHRPALSIPAAPSDIDSQSGRFFRRLDWSAFWTTFLISLAAYVYTLAPTVTLEDSGELAVASDYLGVPHPPGYPIWTLLTWFFQWIFHWVTYYGRPNPAWSVGLASAVSGALACGLLAMLVCRSGSEMLRSMRKTTAVLGYSTENLICWIAAVTGGLLFAFSSVLWSQSVIVEVYSLNALFLVLILLLAYYWMGRPDQDRLIYLFGFAFGLGFTNHQSLLFLGPGLAAAIWFRDRRLFRDCLAVFSVLVGLYLLWKLTGLNKLPQSPEVLKEKNLKTLFVVLSVVVLPVGLFLIERQLMTEWKRVLLLGLATSLGVSFYLYMPFASEQNPPMNWGYPRTKEGFWHAFSRGQYEKISPIANLQSAIDSPSYFFKLLHAILTKPGDYISVVAQFTWPLSLLAVVPFGFLFAVGSRPRDWLWTTLISFAALTVIFVVFQWPKLDVQTMFIGRVQYIQAHAIFALWISYGLIFILAQVDTLARDNRVVTYSGLLLTLLLPLVLIHRNAYDENYLKIVGGTEMNGHDFGWQFGNYQLRGVEGILEELKPGEAPPPNPKYPSPMTTNAVFYGGTDPGRFVPTYMIYSADVRSDVFLITQNALADNTYMSVMRDLYGDQIWIPSQQDSNYAFQKYVEDVQAGRISAGADLSFQGGRVSVQGVQGVMTINGILARMIFEANKWKHDFYVEESYVIPWMYPYLEPHGLILKINKEPMNELNPETVKNDHEFWTWYTARLMGNPKFRRDVVARKTFSKLRSAIAGVYAFRRNYPEAEYAFRQALEMYPMSPEANFRLADLLMQQRRFTDARQLIEQFLKEDPGNDKVEEFLKQIQATDDADSRRRELEDMMGRGADLNSAIELLEIYRRLNLPDRFENLSRYLLSNEGVPPQVFHRVAQLSGEYNRPDLQVAGLQRYLEKEPANPRVWLELSIAQIAMQRTGEAMQALKRAIETGGEPVRDVARKERGFDPVRTNAEFLALVPNIQASLPLNLPGF